MSKRRDKLADAIAAAKAPVTRSSGVSRQVSEGGPRTASRPDVSIHGLATAAGVPVDHLMSWLNTHTGSNSHEQRVAELGKMYTGNRSAWNAIASAIKSHSDSLRGDTPASGPDRLDAIRSIMSGYAGSGGGRRVHSSTDDIEQVADTVDDDFDFTAGPMSAQFDQREAKSARKQKKAEAEETGMAGDVIGSDAPWRQS